MPRGRPKKVVDAVEAGVTQDVEIPVEQALPPPDKTLFNTRKVEIPVELSEVEVLRLTIAKMQAESKMEAELRAKPARTRAPKPVAPPPPNPVVLDLERRLVPLMEKQELIIMGVRHAQKALEEAQLALKSEQQQLADVEATIQRHLNMIANLTGQTARPAGLSRAPHPNDIFTGSDHPHNLRDDVHDFTYGGISRGPASGNELASLPYGNVYPTYGSASASADDYPSLMGSPNIPPSVTSIPAPTTRYSSGYVPNGPDNPRSESADHLRSDPETQKVLMAMARARSAV